MMSRFIMLVGIVILSPLVPSWAFAGEVCQFSKQIRGEKDLARPWPSDLEHSERHTQIQQEIGNNFREFQYCQEKFGVSRLLVRFNVTAEGQIVILSQTEDSQLAQCYGSQLSRIQMPVYGCEFPFAYKWNGEFPLDNAERRTFP